MHLSKNQITQIGNFFQDKPVVKVFLFGSYAVGDANEQSDIDLLVDLDYSKKIGLAFYSWAEELEVILNKKVDVVSNARREIETSNWNFIQRINKEKITLYEKE